MTFKELRRASGMNMTQFSKYFGIPYRTIQNWENGVRQCPEYLLDLMKYKLENEGFILEKVCVKIPEKARDAERHEKAMARLRNIMNVQKKIMADAADAEATAMTLEMKKHFDKDK